MTQRKHTPLHDKWHRRVEGQIRDTITHHPEWFSFENKDAAIKCVNSLAKRIVGEIVAEFTLATNGDNMFADCVVTNNVSGGSDLPEAGGVLVLVDAPPYKPFRWAGEL